MKRRSRNEGKRKRVIISEKDEGNDGKAVYQKLERMIKEKERERERENEKAEDDPK